MIEPRKLSVFLCHASEDKPIVRELYQRLNHEGWVEPWLDEEAIPLGANWKITIEAAIESVDCVIIFLSQKSVRKEGFVQSELKRALDRSLEKPQDVIFLIPFRLDDCEVPPNLRKMQWGDYYGIKKEKTYDSLRASLKQRHEQRLILDEQRLILEAEEQARAEELTRIQKEVENKFRAEELTRIQKEVENKFRAEELIRIQKEVENKFRAEELTRIQEEIENKARREIEEVLYKQAEERARWEEKERVRLIQDIARKEAEAKAIATKQSVNKKHEESTSAPTFSKETGSSIILDGSLVHYEALGRGRPIIYLHTWIGSWRYWLNSMQVASRSFRSYALDLYGFGDTARDPLRYSLNKQADLLYRFLEEMGIGKVALIGHGLGALVGFSFIKQWPKSVDRMMAINCPLNYDDVNPRLRTASTIELVDWLSNRSPEAIYALGDASKADPQAVSASMTGLYGDNLFDQIHDSYRIHVPSLLVYGSNDPAVSIPMQEKTDALPNHMHQINLEEVGHFPMIDNPNQFNRLMTDFLALDSGVSPRELQLKEEWKRRGR